MLYEKSFRAPYSDPNRFLLVENKKTFQGVSGSEIYAFPLPQNGRQPNVFVILLDTGLKMLVSYESSRARVCF